MIHSNVSSGTFCHNRDHTYPYSPYSNLSMPIPSHLNHSRAPNAKPEPSDPLASQQCTPEHSDSLASSQRIPDPMHLRPFLSLVSSRFPTPTLISDPTHPRPFLFLASSRFPTSTPIPDPTPFNLLSSCVSSIPDVSSVSRLRSGEARSRTSLARCVLVRLFSLPIYMFLYVPLSHHSLPSARFPCLILSSPSPSTLVSSIFIPYLRRPYFSYSVHSLRPIPDRSDHPDHYHTPHLYKYTKYKLL